MPHINPRTGYPSTSATAMACQSFALFGHRPSDDEPEYRPMPEDDQLALIATSVLDAVAEPLRDTALEQHIQDIAWSLVNVFHLKADRVVKALDENELRQKDSQLLQDGSEIRSVELERLITRGQSLTETLAAIEHMRDVASEHYSDITGSAWRPRSSSMVNHKKLTAATVDSRDYIAAKRRAETELFVPVGTRIAFTGGYKYTDRERIYAVLDKVLAKHPDMVLLHTAGTQGADLIAKEWATERKVRDVAFRPHYSSPTDRRAVFNRNEALIEALPVGLVVFPGNGITDNLADRAGAAGIPVADYRGSQRTTAPKR